MTECDDLDLAYNPAPVCPHCGHVMKDAWELGEPERTREVDCGACDEPYLVSGHVSVTWSTCKMKEPNR